MRSRWLQDRDTRASMSQIHPTNGSFGRPCRFEQEPGAPLGLVDQVLQKARCCNVTMFVAEPMCFAQI